MQFLRIVVYSNVLLLLGAPLANQLLFMTAAPLLSAFRLFYYGTYVPHAPDSKDDVGPRPWHVSRSSDASPLLSFLTCYCFDLHWEHHRWPYAPWWQLPLCRQLAGRAGARATAGAAVGGDGGGGETAGAGGWGMGAVSGGRGAAVGKLSQARG